MSATIASARSIRWQRRRRAFLDAFRVYSRNRLGMIGLVILALFALVAVFADVLVPPERLSVAHATGIPLSPPTTGFPLGTDELGRSVLDLVIQGAQISLLVGFLATVISVVIG